jgi:hypothetical protein
LAKLADFLVAEGVVDDVSHEGLRVLLREEGVSFQVIKTWKQSTDPDVEAKKNRVLHPYGLMDGTDEVEPDDPEVVICVDEFGPLNLQPTPAPGRQWASRGGGDERPRRRRRATYTRPHGVRHLLAAYDLSRDRPYGHVKPRKRRGSCWSSCATYAPCTRRECGLGSSWTTSARTRPPLTILGNPVEGQQLVHDDLSHAPHLRLSLDATSD